MGRVAKIRENKNRGGEVEIRREVKKRLFFAIFSLYFLKLNNLFYFILFYFILFYFILF